MSDRPTLPETRGPLSDWAAELLARAPGESSTTAPRLTSSEALGEDAQIALAMFHGLAYDGWDGVDERWELDPTLIGALNDWEDAFVERLREELGDLGRGDTVAWLQDLATPAPDAPSTSRWLEEHGDVEHLREEGTHRSLYQRREADPHTFAIPRLRGEPKAALVQIQVDEYGDGKLQDVHAELFAQTLRGLDLDPAPFSHVDLVPAETLATVNLVDTFARARRWRGALMGHLALFEMASVPVMSSMAQTYRRLGFNAWTTLFFDVHVVADAEHQAVASHGLVAPLLEQEPALETDVRLGAAALGLLEGRLTDRILGAWEEGRTSLRAALDPVEGPLPGKQEVEVATDPRPRAELDVPSPA